MVRTLSNVTDWRVIVTTYVLSGREPGSSIIATLEDASPLDAFDYAIHAQGYFRHAIQEMGVSSMSIDVIDSLGRAIETIEISRD
jgi:hypothetical protein